MQIIGIAGRAGSGKSEVARMVQDISGAEVCVIAFAAALKRVARQLGWDGKKDERGRRFLQRLGTDAVRDYEPQAWVRQWRVAVASDCEEWGTDIIIADDVRFENEAAEIHRMGGVLVRVVKPDINADKMSDHVSEQPIPRSYIDYTIQNDGNLEQLRGQVEILLRELAKREGE
jgi:dephospho-CoA kinase|tara:strand:+ start:2271 stop:2792 length:522 start_codon:yes stop_codon:yes gene_type:complete